MSSVPRDQSIASAGLKNFRKDIASRNAEWCGGAKQNVDPCLLVENRRREIKARRTRDEECIAPVADESSLNLIRRTSYSRLNSSDTASAFRDRRFHKPCFRLPTIQELSRRNRVFRRNLAIVSGLPVVRQRPGNSRKKVY
jgi:hypothetical protein